MDQKIRTGFLLLILTQGLHSIEEYIGKLWEVFTPARVLSGLVSDNLRTGFIIINVALFIFGLCCWLFPVRNSAGSAKILISFWIIIELINGIGHPVWALYEGTYVPGLVTAPVLLILALYLTRLVSR